MQQALRRANPLPRVIRFKVNPELRSQKAYPMAPAGEKDEYLPVSVYLGAGLIAK
jgi:hypothetical protein